MEKMTMMKQAYWSSANTRDQASGSMYRPEEEEHVWRRGTYDIKYHKVVIDPEFLERAEQDPTRGSIATRHTLLVDGFSSLVTDWDGRRNMGNVHPAYKDDEHDDQERPTFRDHGLSTWNHTEAGETKVFCAGNGQ
jgi:hypothetical protein